jgi:DNA-binding NarL/FixJ family response regulator
VASAHEAELVLAGGGVAVAAVATELADMAGLEWLGQLRRRNQTVIRLFAPTQSNEELAIAAINLAGVFRYVRQAREQGELARAVAEAIEISGHRSGPPCMREAVAKTIKAHAECRTSTTGCLVLEQQDRAPLPESLLRRLSSQVGWTGMGILSMSIFLFSALVMGIGVFSIIYMVKTSLGIDLIPNWHLHDWLAK